MDKTIFWKCLSICLCLLLLSGQNVHAQGFYTDFGKNRVQYHDFDWSYYESKNFRTYFYQGGFDLGKFTVLTAEKYLTDIESKLEYPIDHKIEIMVYHNLSDLKQSNIGLGLGQPGANTGGVTNIIANKLFIYFNGDHEHIAQQIREGIAQILLQHMVRGGNIQEVLQNAVLLNLPNWFTNGLIAYIGSEWNTDLDNRLREGILEGRYENFSKLSGEESTFAGHALWHYIAQVYGVSAIPNLLYLTRINRSIESGFLFVIGSNLKNTISDFNEYYYKFYKKDLDDTQTVLDSNRFKKTTKRLRRRGVLFKEIKISPDGRFIAYATDEEGRQKVYVLDTETGKHKAVVKVGYRAPNQIIETNYPLIAWDRLGKKVAIVYERRDEIRLTTYQPLEEEKETAPITKFQQVIDLGFTDNSNTLVMSADKVGYPDIYTYYIPNTKTTRLTNDYYADLQPRYMEIGGYRGIAFISNRPTDTLRVEKLDTLLPQKNYDVFFYNLGQKDGLADEEQLIRITNTPLAQETLPLQYDSTHLAFLSDKNGIRNQYAAYLDSVFVRTDTKVFFQDSLIVNPTYDLTPYQTSGLIDTIIQKDLYKVQGKSFAITNYDRNIREHDVAVRAGKVIRLHKNNGFYEFFKTNRLAAPKDQQQRLRKTTYRQQLENWSKAALYKKDTRKFDITKRLPFNSSTITDEAINSEPATSEPVTNEPVSQPPDSTNIDIENYYFQSEFDYIVEEEINNNNSSSSQPVDQRTSEPTDQSSSKPANQQTSAIPIIGGSKKVQQDDRVFKRTKIRKHKVKFSIDEVVTQLDNTIIFNQYQNFTTTGIGFDTPDLNALIKVGIVDLMEDYRVTGGFRLPVGLGGSEYFVEYQALRKRLDKKFLAYRRADRNTVLVTDIPDLDPFPAEVRNIMTYGQVSLSYPFDVVRSLRGHFGLRHDQLNVLSSDFISLQLPSVGESWGFMKLEYVFDNTVEVATNLLNGMRYKVYAEVHKPFELQLNDRNVDFNIKNTGLLGIVGLDVRHYQRVHKQITWANRVASASSFGSRKMIYYLGGVENWLQFNQDKRFNSDTPIDESRNYGFQSLATNMRGFRQNVRNGNSFATFNSELRVPIFSYLARNPLRSEFLRSFQLVGFFDAGMAWDGISPFTEENRYYTIVVPDDTENTPVIATVNFYKNPLVFGYGAGARARLLGYFMRLDVAWGHDSGARTDPRWYFSMGLDF